MVENVKAQKNKNYELNDKLIILLNLTTVQIFLKKVSAISNLYI